MPRLQSTVTIHDATLRNLARQYQTDRIVRARRGDSRRQQPYAWRNIDQRVIATAMRLAKRDVRRITHDGGALIVHNKAVW